MPPSRTVGISAARLGWNWARSSMRQRLSKRPKWTPRSTSMWGRLGLNTVGSCESATTACIVGPGTIAQAHKPDEHGDLNEYRACIEHLIDCIWAWCTREREQPGAS